MTSQFMFNIEQEGELLGTYITISISCNAATNASSSKGSTLIVGTLAGKVEASDSGRYKMVTGAPDATSAAAIVELNSPR